jgi:putative ABC transport system ATP-binding protein
LVVDRFPSFYYTQKRTKCTLSYKLFNIIQGEQDVSVLQFHRPKIAFPVETASTIELHDVTKVYQTQAGSFTALGGIDLIVQPGEFVAVIGKSGSGKSTLLNLLAGIDRPTTGEVMINGVPIHTLNEDQVAIWRGRNIGVVFQFFQLLPTLTVQENLLLAMDFCGVIPGNQRLSRAKELLDLVGVYDQADKLPSALSGGQQQRAAIARALANDPPLLVADEPTGNLDSINTELVMGLFQQFTQNGKTVLMVTHEREINQYVTRSIRLSDGQVVAQSGENYEHPQLV